MFTKYCVSYNTIQNQIWTVSMIMFLVQLVPSSSIMSYMCSSLGFAMVVSKLKLILTISAGFTKPLSVTFSSE